MEAPITGMVGTKGVLKGRSISGFLFRNTKTLRQTITKASKVPIETSSPSIEMGRIPAIIMANDPVSIVLKYGVLNLG